jgi:hypothetical protein
MATHPLQGRPDRTFLLSIVAVIFGATAIVLGVVFHYSDQSTTLHRIQNGLCGLVVPLSHQKQAAATSSIGRTLVVNSGRSAVSIKCPHR